MAALDSADHPRRRYFRALLLTASLLTGVTILAERSSSVAQADRVAPPHWAISVAADEAFRLDGGPGSDAGPGLDLRIVRHGTAVAVVAVRRHRVAADATRFSVGQAVFSRRILGVGLPSDVPMFMDRAGPYPAVELHYINDDGKATLFVLAFVAEETDAYTFTLRIFDASDAGYAYRCFERLTRSVRPVK